MIIFAGYCFKKNSYYTYDLCASLIVVTHTPFLVDKNVKKQSELGYLFLLEIKVLVHIVKVKQF